MGTMSSDEDDEMGERNGGYPGDSTGVLTNLLFGNVNAEGALEDDIFDDQARRSLHQLTQMGVGGLVRELAEECQEDGEVDYTQGEKSAAAIDYSDETELADELLDADDKSRVIPKVSDYSKLSFEGDNRDGVTVAGQTPDTSITAPLETKDKSKIQTTEPIDSSASVTANASNENCNAANVDENTKLKVNDALINTPLARMLPEKYRHADVTRLFPYFRPGKVLRFSRLFGPGKANSLPQIWRGVRRRRKKRKHEDASINQEEREVVLDILDGERIPPEMLEPSEAVELDAKKEDEDKREKKLEDEEKAAQDSGQPVVADFRFGPAQLWYDMFGIGETGDTLDYGFKLIPEEEAKNTDKYPHLKQFEPTEEHSDIPEDAFLMVTQLPWEDEIIWNADDHKHKVNAAGKSGAHAAGWVPSIQSRTFSQQKPPPMPTLTPLQPEKNGHFSAANQKSHQIAQSALQKAAAAKGVKPNSAEDTTWYSIFPVENEELVYSAWEEEVIWDAQAMIKVPAPQMLTLDPNDENIILGVPDDPDPAKMREPQAQTKEKKNPNKDPLRKSRILLGKAGVIAEPEPQSPQPPKEQDQKDPFNISNDEFYNPRQAQDSALKPNVGGNLIQHSIPAIELRQPFFPTHMGPLKLRSIHRPALKRFSHGPLASPGPHGVISLLKNIRRKQKERDAERQASGGGEMFFMRTPEDLSGKDGELVLTEYSEEHPPLVMQIGMASKMKNYYKRKPGKDHAPDLPFGEMALAHTSPFLGQLAPGQCQPAFENNLFRAPMFEHQMPVTDFLIIRTRQHYYVREIETIFTVGQELPLYEVPGPNSKRANNFIRDFLQVFIYRLFWKSRDHPRRIKMEDIRKAFPNHSESSIRKRLKQCADFKRTGMDSNWWVLKPDFRLPTEDEIRAMVSPEQCCGYYSMLAAEQRLKDAGYGEKSLFTADEENEDDLQNKIDDEVKTAPWNTTRAFIQAMKGKCLLQLAGVADPTGCGEGFSYVRIPNKPVQSKDEERKEAVKKTVTGTDADLRRLSLSNAKSILRKFGVPEDEIKKLSRWEVIDVVRTLSTEQAKAGEDGMGKFARGNRFSIAEHQERYKEECQRLFELQNRVLSSQEVLSTDEESSAGEEESDEDIEEMGKNIENMLANKKTSSQLSHEKEEAERRELQKLIMGDDGQRGKGDLKDKKDDEKDATPKILKIYRTFKNSKGKEYVRIETVRKQAIIDTYVRIRETKDKEFIRQFAMSLDESQKEEMRKERRRIQEQLRRLKRNQEREKLGPNAPLTPSRKRFKKDAPQLKLKCGACGLVGHMRTNKACPKYMDPLAEDGSPQEVREDGEEPEIEEEEEPDSSMALQEDNLVKVDETRVVLSKTLIQHADELRRKSLVLKIPKVQKAARRSRVATSTTQQCDYLRKPAQSANRRRTDPLVTLSSTFELILNEMRDLPDTQLFAHPVNSKTVPDYYNIVQRPMDLQKIREKLHEHAYHDRQEFIDDVHQIVENSKLYNGPKSPLTHAAERMLDLCFKRFAEKEEALMRLEKAINPLLDDNDQVALSFLLENIVESLKAIPESWPFHKPVNKKFVKDYYEVIKKPMDLDTVVANAKAHRYHSRQEFLADIELMYTNSVQFNGIDSPFTSKGKEIVDRCIEILSEQDEQLSSYENAISLTLEAAETDSLNASRHGDAVKGEEEMVDVEGEGQDDDYHGGMDEGDFEGDTEQETEPNDVDAADQEPNNNPEGAAGSEQDQQNNNLGQDLEMTPDNSPDHSDHDDNASHYSDDDNRGVLLTRSSFQAAANNNPGAQQEDEEMIDENYDPSEFLLQGDFQFQSNQNQNANVHRNQQLDDEDDEADTTATVEGEGRRQSADEVENDEENQTRHQQREQLSTEATYETGDESRQEPWAQDNQDDAMDSDGGAIHNDLVISESEEEKDAEDDREDTNNRTTEGDEVRENANVGDGDAEDIHDDDEDDGIWF